MSDRGNKLREELKESGYKAVEELIKIAKAPIIKGNIKDDDIAAEKMKNAAAAKKLAIEDAYAILSRVEQDEEVDSSKKIDENKAKSGDEGFAERRAT